MRGGWWQLGRKKRRGFTLVEVVVALGIFALMSVVLLQTVSSVQQALIHIDEKRVDDDARRFVMRRIMEATSRDAVTAGGAVQLSDGGTVSWSALLLETDVPDLHRVTLQLEWADGEQQSMELWAYRPEWSDSAARSALLQSLREAYPSSRLSTF